MAILLDKHADGSLALFIDGDLQFDSRDERVYHECLALPALALATRRRAGQLRALICGGGDGLTARELLKTPTIAQIDLVDYDATILSLARNELAALNERSLADRRVRVYVEDAYAFVERAVEAGQRYDLIVMDLTVPQELEALRLQSVEWYALLRALLPPEGVLAANAVSPCATPDAYWSIYNTMRTAGLHPRPYRIILPSFSAMRYGDDWGFLLAGPAPISAAELDDDLPLLEDRRELRSAAQLRRLFTFPEAVAARREHARPTATGSDLLLHYLYSGEEQTDATGHAWDALAFERDDAALPPADSTLHLLPPSVTNLLGEPFGAPIDEERLFQRLMKMLPGLSRFQTREMVAAFIENPARFLAGSDLPGLVERLLRSAAELPRRLVAELRLLQRKLREYAGNHARLLQLGLRIVTIITLVVIVSNLLYPDTTFAKGNDGGSGAIGSSVSTGQHSLSRPSHGSYMTVVDPPEVALNGGFRNRALGSAATVDELGMPYPPRRYRYYPRYYGGRGYSSYRYGTRPEEQPREEAAFYWLTPEAAILANGEVAINLTDDAYLLLADNVASVVDQQTGLPVLFLQRDPAQIWRAGKEIERQRLGLEQSAQAKQSWISWMAWMELAPWHEDDQVELENLKQMSERLGKALQSLGPLPPSLPALASPPVAGAREVFSSVWMLDDGKVLVLQLPENQIAFMDGKGWYSDQARTTPRSDPYPADFKKVVVSYLTTMLKDQQGMKSRLEATLSDARLELTELQRDKVEYEQIKRTSPESELVEYGSSEITLREALRLTYDDLARVEQRIKLLQDQISGLPGDAAAAHQMIKTLGG